MKIELKDKSLAVTFSLKNGKNVKLIVKWKCENCNINHYVRNTFMQSIAKNGTLSHIVNQEEMP